MTIGDDIGGREDRRNGERNWEGMAQVGSGRGCRGRHEREDMIGCGRGICYRRQGKALGKH